MLLLVVASVWIGQNFDSRSEGVGEVVKNRNNECDVRICKGAGKIRKFGEYFVRRLKWLSLSIANDFEVFVESDKIWFMKRYSLALSWHQEENFTKLPVFLKSFETLWNAIRHKSAST